MTPSIIDRDKAANGKERDACHHRCRACSKPFHSLTSQHPPTRLTVARDSDDKMPFRPSHSLLRVEVPALHTIDTTSVENLFGMVRPVADPPMTSKTSPFH